MRMNELTANLGFVGEDASLVVFSLSVSEEDEEEEEEEEEEEGRGFLRWRRILYVVFVGLVLCQARTIRVQ